MTRKRPNQATTRRESRQGRQWTEIEIDNYLILYRFICNYQNSGVDGCLPVVHAASAIGVYITFHKFNFWYFTLIIFLDKCFSGQAGLRKQRNSLTFRGQRITPEILAERVKQEGLLWLRYCWNVPKCSEVWLSHIGVIDI